MTGQPPSSGSDRRDPLGFDEIVALLVAFTVVGAVLWWSIGRRAETWLGEQQFPALGTEGSQTVPEDTIRTDPQTGDVLVEPDTDRSPAPSTGLPVSPIPQTGRTGIPRTAVIPGVVAPVVPADEEPIEQPTSPSAVPGNLSTSGAAPAIVVPSVSPEAAVSFPDVPSDYWAYPFITELSRRGIISGFDDGRFQPDRPVTRAEYAALVSKVLPNNQQTQITFGDVPIGFWGAPAIDEAVKTGFLKGYPDATFQPNQAISRMQVLLSLANGFQLPKPADPDLPLQVFDDRAQIPEWAKPALAAATTSNVVVNYPNLNLVNPNQPATRAEVAAMLYQALTTTGQQLPLIESNYIVRP